MLPFPLLSRTALGALVVLTSLSAATPSDAPRLHPGVDAPPPRMLWAWERPADLRFLGARHDVGVAFLASTIVVDGYGGAHVVPRRSPLELDPRTFRTAVIRVEPRDGDVVRDTEAVRAVMRREVSRVLALPHVRALQLDFDARASERAAHAAFVETFANGLPASMHFSVTTLASHCFGDPFAGASVTRPHEIVPMYFRMGADDAVVRRALRERAHPPVPVCRASAGFAIDEPRPDVVPATRAYIFLTGVATEARVNATLDTLVVR